MKEYVGCARNIFFSEQDEEQFQVCAEFILLTCEPAFELGFGSEIVRKRVAEQYRFVITPDSGRSLVKRLNDAIEAMEEAKGRSPSPVSHERGGEA